MGEFVLFESTTDDMEVQARFAPIGDHLSVTSAVAMNVANANPLW
ncbi:MAG: hypothetical protein ACR2OH_07285 [Microthrixaceae bacterium]